MDLLDFPIEIIWYIMDMCDKESLCILLKTGNTKIFNIIISDTRCITYKIKGEKYIKHCIPTYLEKIIGDPYLFGDDNVCISLSIWR